MLKIENLRVKIEGQEILKGITLSVNKGELHAIMGPNGSGKSTLAAVLAGRDFGEITAGKITYMGKNLLEMEAEDRAKEGIFLGFQYPIEIPGVSMVNFMKTALNEHRKYRGQEPLSSSDFLKLMREKKELVKIESGLTNRSVNEGFSGGERKKIETLQMLFLQPKYAIMDEVDTGLDVDALKAVAKGIQEVVRQNTGVIIITHYNRILKHIKPDRVHVMIDGKIAASGSADLAKEIEKRGYSVYIKSNIKRQNDILNVKVL